MDFDSRLHQKVTYLGTDSHIKRSSLYVVFKAEFPNFYLMKPEDEVVIHIVDRNNQILHNPESQIRKAYTVKKSELIMVGDLTTP